MIDPQLYPPRERATNVTLIKDVMYARDQQSFERADAELGRSLRPSLFSELDWLELALPPEQRERGAEVSEGIFVRHLPAIVRQRLIQFDVRLADGSGLLVDRTKNVIMELTERELAAHWADGRKMDFFTNKTGVFAAATAVLAFTAGVLKLVQARLKNRRDADEKRREAEESKPNLEFSEVRVSDPPPCSESGEATYRVSSGCRGCDAKRLRGRSESSR
jgi:hypothetical protein